MSVHGQALEFWTHCTRQIKEVWERLHMVLIVVELVAWRCLQGYLKYAWLILY